MKWAIVITLMVMCFGCCRKMSSISSERTDSVRMVYQTKYVERVRDSLVYVPVPVAEVERYGVPDSSHLETGIASSDAWIGGDGKLNHTLKNKNVSIPATVPVKEVEQIESRDSIVYRDIQMVETVERKHIPKFFWFCFVVTLVLAGFGALKLWRKIKA